MTGFNIDFCASKETTISEAYIPDSKKCSRMPFSHQLALGFGFTHGYRSKENFSQSTGNVNMELNKI